MPHILTQRKSGVTTEQVEAALPPSVVSGSAAGATAVQPASIALISPLAYGAKFNGRRIEDATIEAGSHTVTGSELAAADAGKVIAIAGAGAGGATLLTTIESAAAGTATLAAAAGTAVAAATAIYASDDSAAWKAMAESMVTGRGYRVTCPEGRSFFNGITFGSIVSKSGVTLEFVGAGRRGTFLYPLSASGAGTMITINGPADSTCTGVKFDAMTVGMDFPDPIIDMPYTAPIVRLVGIQGYDINVLSRWYGTGVIWKFDGSYEGRFSGGRMNTGRYAIGIESNDEVESPPQEDTMRFGDTFVHQGNYGVVARNIGNGLDSVVFDQFKSALYTPTKEEGKTFSGHQDREHFSEGKLAKEAKEATSTLELEAGQAAAMGYETANLPLPIMIEYGDHVEVNKVTAAAGDTLTLKQPLRWTHATAAVVVRGTCALNFSTNVQSLTIGDGCHIEGHSCAAVQVAGGKLITVRGGANSSRAALRLCGGTVNAKVMRTTMVGNALLTAGPRNIAIDVPAWNTNTALSRLYVEELELGSGAEAITYLYDPGNNAKKVYYRLQELPSGVPKALVNVPTGEATTASTLVHEELTEEGATRWERLTNGAYVLREDTRMKRRGTGSMIFEYWNGTEWVEAKGVAIGASEIRWGEDTTLVRESIQKLIANGQLNAEDGLTTISLSGAGLITVTDALFKHAPPNGTIAVHRDTTLKRAYLSIRAGGEWQLISGDYDTRGQAGILTPQAPGWRFSTVTAVTGTAYVMRFKATLPLVLTKGVFRLTTKATSNDKVEIGLLNAEYKRIATSGEVESILNGALGMQSVPLAYTLVPGTVYYSYLAFGTVGGTAAVVGGAEYASGTNAQFFGSGAGTCEFDSHTGDAPMPETFVGGGLPVTVPVLALRVT